MSLARFSYKPTPRANLGEYISCDLLVTLSIYMPNSRVSSVDYSRCAVIAISYRAVSVPERGVLVTCGQCHEAIEFMGLMGGTW